MVKIKYFVFTISVLLFFIFTVAAQQTGEVNPKALELMTRGDFRGAISVLDKDVNDRKNIFQSYKLRGSIKRIIGDFSGAIDDFSNALEIKSDNGELYEMRAMTRFNIQGDFGLILQDLDAAISYGRKYEKIYTLRGMIKRQRGDIDGAIADYQTAVGLRPESASAHVGLSSLYGLKKEDEKAAFVLEQFIKYIEDSNKKVGTVKGEITAGNSVDLPALSDGKYQAGQVTVIIKRDGNLPTVNGAPSQEMIDKMTDKMEQSKNTALAYVNLAAIYERRQDYLLALETVEKGLKIDPTDFYGYEMRGRIKLALDDYEGAVADLSKSISMMPMKSIKYLDRGIAYLMLGRNAEAQKDFEKYLEFFPNAKETLEKRIEAAKLKLSK